MTRKEDTGEKLIKQDHKRLMRLKKEKQVDGMLFAFIIIIISFCLHNRKLSDPWGKNKHELAHLEKA